MAGPASYIGDNRDRKHGPNLSVECLHTPAVTGAFEVTDPCV